MLSIGLNRCPHYFLNTVAVLSPPAAANVFCETVWPNSLAAFPTTLYSMQEAVRALHAAPVQAALGAQRRESPAAAAPAMDESGGGDDSAALRIVRGLSGSTEGAWAAAAGAAMVTRSVAADELLSSVACEAVFTVGEARGRCEHLREALAVAATSGNVEEWEQLTIAVMFERARGQVRERQVARRVSELSEAVELNFAVTAADDINTESRPCRGCTPAHLQLVTHPRYR
jgi:hypothetical protein